MKSCLFVCASLFFVLLTCSPHHPTTPSDDGSLELTVKLGDVGSLAKMKVVELDTLTITLTAPGEDSIVDKTALSGNTRQTITKTFSDMASIKTWTANVAAIDKAGKTIHSGITTFVIKPYEKTDVTLDLAAHYSMLRANFFPIRDSVNACKLIVDGNVVADSSFDRKALRGDTVRLSFDYLAASPEGIEHTIRLDVRGILWGDDTLLYRGDTVITVVSGVNATYAIKLTCLIKDAPPGIAAMTVTLGAAGNVTINGELEDHEAIELSEVLAVNRQAGDSINTWLETSSINEALNKLAAVLNTQKNVKNVAVSEDSTVVTIEYLNGLRAIALFGKPGTLSFPGNDSGITASVDRDGERVIVHDKLSAGTAITMTGMKDAAFSLHDFLHLGKYGVVHIASHGGVLNDSSFFITGQDAQDTADPDNWPPDINDEKSWWQQGMIVPEIVSGKWAVLPKFIKNECDPFSSSLVILSTCNSMATPILYNTFLHKGAATVVGWKGEPFSDTARSVVESLLVQMIDSGKTIDVACQYGNKTMQPSNNTSLIFQGKADMQFPPRLSRVKIEGTSPFKSTTIHKITWYLDQFPDVDSCHVFISFDSLKSFSIIGKTITDSFYSWTIPNRESNVVFIKVTAYKKNNENLSLFSNMFSITSGANGQTSGNVIILRGTDTVSIFSDTLKIWAGELASVYTDTIDRWVAPSANGFISSGPAFSFRNGTMPTGTALFILAKYTLPNTPYSENDIRIYRYNIHTGSWRIESTTPKFNITRSEILFSIEDLQFPCAVMIDTTTPEILNFMRDTGIYSVAAPIIDTFSIHDNIENLQISLFAGSGTSGYNDISTYVTPGNITGTFTSTIPSFTADQCSGLRAIIVVSDGRNRDTINLSRKILRTSANCDDITISSLEWTPLSITAQPKMDALSDVFAKALGVEKFEYDSSTQRIIQWLPNELNSSSSDKWVEYNSNLEADFTFKPGKLFWIKSKKNLQISFGNALIPALVDTIEITLNAGEWTDFSLPYNFDIYLGDIIGATLTVNNSTNNFEIYEWIQFNESASTTKPVYLSEIIADPQTIFKARGAYTAFNGSSEEIILRIPPICTSISTFFK